MDKKELKEREAKVIELAVNFCNEKLDEECATLCTQLIQKLGRKRTNLGGCSSLHNMQHQLHIQQGLPTKLDIEWHLWIFWHKQLNHGAKVEDDKRLAEDKSSIRSQLFIERDCHKQSFQSSSNVKWIFLLRLKSKDKATLRAFLANSNAPCKKMGQSSTILAWCIVCYIKGTNGGNTCL